MVCSLETVIDALAAGLHAIDRCGVPYKAFRPGVGPYGEADAIRRALQHMRESNPKLFDKAKAKRLPDILIPGEWAIEAKVVRPFGNNGVPAEHWSENILHPYRGNTSSLGDCLKLLESGLPERKAIVVFGYEHAEPLIPLDPAICSFEVLAAEIMKIRLSERSERRIDGLCHPVHQVLRVFGWEVLGRAPG
jgi:hypothetical protein